MQALHEAEILPPSWSSCDAKAAPSPHVAEASDYRDDGAAVSVKASENRMTQILRGDAEANEIGWGSSSVLEKGSRARLSCEAEMVSANSLRTEHGEVEANET